MIILLYDDFILYIKAALGENDRQKEDTTPDKPLFEGESAKEIMVVEDNSINQKLLKRVLREENLNITFCQTAEEALDILSNQKFDLIFMDIQLPGISGIEATQKIKKEMRLKTPVVALSANVSHADIQRSKEAGMEAHVGKPFRQAEIRAVIQKYVPSSSD